MNKVYQKMSTLYILTLLFNCHTDNNQVYLLLNNVKLTERKQTLNKILIHLYMYK